MPKYRKKPVVVDAIQNVGEWQPIMAWLDSLNGAPVRIPFGHAPSITRNEDGTLNIVTLEGVMRADVGDFVIRGVSGEFYPCKSDIFEATYRPVN